MSKSAAFYRKMVSEIEDYAIILMDKDGIIQDWNKGAERIKGYKAEEIIGKSFLNFYRQEDIEKGLPDKLIAEAKKNGRAAAEGLRKRKDGSVFWGSIVITSIHDDANNVIGFSKVTRDLTERKVAEERMRIYAKELEVKNRELKRSEELYHRMIAEIEDYAIILLDKEGIIQNWNKGAERIKGYKAEEIIGKSFRNFYTPEDQEKHLPDKLIADAAKNGRAADEGLRKRKDGSTFWGSIVITAIHDESNNVIGFSKVTRDLDITQYANKLEEQNKQLEHFAYIASHDLKSPLRKISIINQMLLKQESENLSESGRENLKRSFEAANRMQTLTDDLLNFSLSTSDSVFEWVDLNNIVKEIEVIRKEDIEEKHATIEMDPLPVVCGIPFQLHQLFDNLIGNALKYHHPQRHPFIKITSSVITGSRVAETGLDMENKYHHISITDDGLGFEQKYAGKIFEVFQRLHGKSEYSGSGIGLATCMKVVKNHKGLINAKGSPGEGAQFNIFLPISS